MIFEFVSDFDIRISDFNHSGCFMQNKPNLLDSQMNVTTVLTKDYENERPCRSAENKANQSQYKPNSRNVPIDVNLVKTRNYNNEQRTMNYELLCKTNPILSAILSGVASAKTEALAKADSKGPLNITTILYFCRRPRFWPRQGFPFCRLLLAKWALWEGYKCHPERYRQLCCV